MMAIPVVVMIMLSAAGLAYAHWTDLIRINGIVKTGTLSIGFDHAYCIDKETWWFLHPELAPPGWEYKDVACCDCWLDEEHTDVHTNKTGYKKLWINITNAYPSYWCNVTFVLRNLGTIPGIFQNFTLIGCPPLVFVSTGPGMWEAVDTDLGKVVFNLEFIDLVGIQLDPCHKTKAEVDIHFKQTAPECHSYCFDIEIGIIQWDP